MTQLMQIFGQVFLVKELSNTAKNVLTFLFYALTYIFFWIFEHFFLQYISFLFNQPDPTLDGSYWGGAAIL